ncbi:Phospholipid-transporting ATPase [Fasciola hepatica]|uniref:Phospholipid-transporting ATPase n=1 Tax=Fasciola hepatica TaxID=6192 RepID=A0A4E0R971_FASHE|nr:Phospholipid-transporting ATPase [Fasciola hepatica]
MCLCGVCTKKTKDVRRIIYPNDITSFNPITFCGLRKYCGNRIITSHYTWWNFVPKNLYEQFHHIPNLLFSIFALVYLFAIGADMAGALFIIVSFNMCITMIKDGISDVFRHNHDRTLNCKLFKYLNVNLNTNSIEWKKKNASDIHVGNIIMCENGDEFPCDMILLAASDSKRKVEVTTANLDGETSVKTYFAHSFTQANFLRLTEVKEPTAVDSIVWLERLLIEVECEEPIADLRLFEGTIKWKRQVLSDSERLSEAIRYENVVLRGARLKSEGYVIGMPVYTGSDTKLSLNCKMVSRKYTSRESKLNSNLVGFMLLSIAMSVIFTIGTVLWSVKNMKNIWYIPPSKFTIWRLVQGFLVYTFTTNTLVPISLVVTLELIQMFLAAFISNDIKMYDRDQQLKSNTKAMHIADELGQVEFLFSDKTGTLTKNMMKLDSLTAFPTYQAYSIKHGQLFAEEKRSVRSKGDLSTHRLDKNQGSFHKSDGNTVPNNAECLLTVASLCNTVEVKHVITLPTDGIFSEESLRSSYYATSPDEEALVIGAAQLGFILTSSESADGGARQVQVMRKHKNADNEVEYKSLDYIVDAVLQFDFERKRMTVMARHPSGTCYIHSKGAESSMLSPEYRIGSSSRIQTEVLEQVSNYALCGLRTLVMASREVPKDEYEKLLKELNIATQMFGRERAESVSLVYKKIESDLEVVGVTGVEDLLQDGVPDCLSSLRGAGIRVWVLTGDKEQTAINISQSAGLFSEDTSIFRITNCSAVESVARRILELLEGVESLTESRKLETPRAASTEAVREVLAAATEAELDDKLKMSGVVSADENLAEIVTNIGKLRVRLSELSVRKQKRLGMFRMDHSTSLQIPKKPTGLVVDGQSLTFALETVLRPAFLDLCMYVNTVLCCRMTPIQKAAVIEMVREGMRERYGGRVPVTAAIGDGGNDVAMIQQASVGIGIYGREGRESVRAADFAIPQFCNLKRLLLVHGYWDHYRITRTMLLYYNKCTMFMTVRLLAIAFAGFSGTAWFDALHVVLYNLTMTSLASTAYGIVEKPFTAQQLLDNPHLYSKTSHHRNLRARNLALHVLDGLWQGVVIFITVFYVFGGGSSFAASRFDQRGNGKLLDYDSSMTAVALFFLIVFCTILRITIEMRDLNVFYLGSLLCTVFLNGAIIICVQMFVKPTNYHAHIYVNVLGNATFWLSVPVAMFVSMLPGLLWRVISDHEKEKQLNENPNNTTYGSQNAIPTYEAEIHRESFVMSNFRRV